MGKATLYEIVSGTRKFLVIDMFGSSVSIYTDDTEYFFYIEKFNDKICKCFFKRKKYNRNSWSKPELLKEVDTKSRFDYADNILGFSIVQ